MAKKFGKFLLGATVIGAAAAAAAYYYYQKKDDDAITLDDEYEAEFEDEDEDEETGYVSLGKATASTDEKIFTPLSETAKKVEEAAEEATETVEEFFDEDDTLEATEIDDSEDD